MSGVRNQTFLVQVQGQVGDFGSLTKSRTGKLQMLVE